MRTIGSYLGISKQTEVLILTLVGICYSIFDTSLLDVNHNLNQAWNILMDPKKVPMKIQLIMKYILSGVILVQAFSVHVYLAFYIVMLWPLVCEDKPRLLIPWLTIGAIKNMVVSVVVLFLGLYTCAAHGLFKPICADFIITEIVKYVPPIYMWFCVLSYYKELKDLHEDDSVVLESKSQSTLIQQLTLRRKTARSMTKQKIFEDRADDGRNLISESTIRTLMHQLTSKYKTRPSRSLDTMLQILANEEEQEEIMDEYDEIFEDNEEEEEQDESALSVKEKALKFLRLTEGDIDKAKFEIDIRKKLIASDTDIDLSKHKKLNKERILTPELQKNSLTTSSILRKLKSTSSEIELNLVSADASFVKMRSNAKIKSDNFKRNFFRRSEKFMQSGIVSSNKESQTQVDQAVNASTSGSTSENEHQEVKKKNSSTSKDDGYTAAYKISKMAASKGSKWTALHKKKK